MPGTTLALAGESLNHEEDFTVARRLAAAVGARLVGVPEGQEIAAVVRRGSAAVLVVPAGAGARWPDDRPPRVLVPLDGSDAAREALGPALKLVRSCAASLVLVRVIDLPVDSLGDRDLGRALTAEVELAGVRGYLHGLALELPRDHLSATVHARLGPPAETILHVARQERADLIVLTTHGQANRPSTPLGSVAAAILAGAAVPVLLVRPHAFSQARRRAPAVEPVVAGRAA
ncbi:MAG: universal stress protein [Chloroflexi bacterium]|nr:universal stress protein [Chloroflexota bacterium]